MIKTKLFLAFLFTCGSFGQIFIEKFSIKLPSETFSTVESYSNTRDTSMDIRFEPNETIYQLQLGDTIPGELSSSNPYCYYKFSSPNKVLTKLKLYRNFTYYRGVTCDVYKKMGIYNYYMHMFTYDSSDNTNSTDFPEVPYFPGEVFLYRIRDKDGTGPRFSILGEFEEVVDTNVMQYDYNNNYLKSFYVPLSEQLVTSDNSSIGAPENEAEDLRVTVSNVDVAPYNNITKLITPIYYYQINLNTIVTSIYENHASGFLLKGNVLGTGGHCILSDFSGEADHMTDNDPRPNFGRRFSRPKVYFGVNGSLSIDNFVLPDYGFVTKNYYFKLTSQYDYFDFGFLKFSNNLGIESSFELYDNSIIDSNINFVKENVIANGYTGGEYVQKERNVSYFSRQNIHTMQGYANVCGGQSGGPLYMKVLNSYYVLGNISGYHHNIVGLNYFATYDSFEINLYNIIKNM